MSETSSKEKIVSSFLYLISKYPYSKISVTDIISHADISRISFYRNFEDKPALVTYVSYTDFNSFVHIYGANATWKEIMICILNSIKNNSDFYKNILMDDESLNCVISAMRKVSITHTNSSGRSASSLIIKKTLELWAKKDFYSPVEIVYNDIVSQFPIREILTGKELEEAIKNYESKTIFNFKSENFTN